MNIFQDQARMMRAFGHTTDVWDTEQINSYLRMIVEETCETLVAANPKAKDQLEWLFKQITPHAHVAPDADKVELLDGLVDVLVVTAGAGLSAGFPMSRAWGAVFDTNMTKVDPLTGKVVKINGKVQKPLGFVPPTEALRRLLANELP